MVGYLGYPMIQYMENIKLKNKDNIKIPDAILIRPKIVAVFDNIKDNISLMSVSYPNKKYLLKKHLKIVILLSKTIKKLEKLFKIFNNKNKSKLSFKSNFTKEEFYKVVKKAKNLTLKMVIFFKL